MSSIYDLPCELISEIYSYLVLPKHATKFSLTCTWIYNLYPRERFRLYHTFIPVFTQIKSRTVTIYGPVILNDEEFDSSVIEISVHKIGKNKNFYIVRHHPSGRTRYHYSSSWIMILDAELNFLHIICDGIYGYELVTSLGQYYWRYARRVLLYLGLSHMVMTIEELPKDIIRRICSYLVLRDIISLSISTSLLRLKVDVRKIE